MANLTSSRPWALLTGASSGIGAKVAPLLARDGYDLILVARREDRLAILANEIRSAVPGAQVRIFPCDLAAPGAAEKVFAAAPDAQTVINCAGYGYAGDALASSLENYRQMLQLNAGVLTDLTYLYSKKMAAGSGGVILNVASTAAFSAIPNFSIYAATKAYVLRMSEALDFELRSRGVRVLTFCPGPTDTEFASQSGVPGAKSWHLGLIYQTPDRVAEDLVRAIRNRSQTYIPGFLNRLLAFFQAHGPKRLIASINARVFGSHCPSCEAVKPRTRSATRLARDPRSDESL